MALELSIKKVFEGFVLDAGLRIGDELFVLFGPSGAGKSLLLRMISGLVRPDEGGISIDSKPVFDSGRGIDVPIRKRGVGFVFQDYALFPHMTVFENIAYGVGNSGAGDIRSRVEDLLSLTGLRGLEHRYPHELSGGQKQRTALARTLAAGPRVLLLDEPFSALDHQVREKLRADILDIHAKFPMSTIFVTHDLEEAFVMADRMAVMNSGRIEQAGTRDDVFYRPASKSVARFIGIRNIFDGRILNVRDGEVVIRTGGLGDFRATAPDSPLKAGQKVSFCIRPEDIPVIRPGRPIKGALRHNLLNGTIYSIMDRGSYHSLTVMAGGGGTALYVDVPHFVSRRLGLMKGESITVALKKASIWVIPEGEGICTEEDL